MSYRKSPRNVPRRLVPVPRILLRTYFIYTYFIQTFWPNEILRIYIYIILYSRKTFSHTEGNVTSRLSAHTIYSTFVSECIHMYVLSYSSGVQLCSLDARARVCIQIHLARESPTPGWFISVTVVRSVFLLLCCCCVQLVRSSRPLAKIVSIRFFFKFTR